MKKVFVTLLMLMMVVGLFAESKDTAKVTATVGAVNKAWFAEEQNTQEKPGELQSVPMGSGALDANSTATIYAVGKTNKMEGFSLTVYGTALTLVTDEDENKFDGNNYIGITVTVAEEENTDTSSTAKSKSFNTPVDTGSTAAATTEGEGFVIAVVPPTSVVPDTGTRIKEKTLKISVTSGADGADKIDTVASGSYWAYLTLVYDTNA